MVLLENTNALPYSLLETPNLAAFPADKVTTLRDPNKISSDDVSQWLGQHPKSMSLLEERPKKRGELREMSPHVKGITVLLQAKLLDKTSLPKATKLRN